MKNSTAVPSGAGPEGRLGDSIQSAISLANPDKVKPMELARPRAGPFCYQGKGSWPLP